MNNQTNSDFHMIQMWLDTPRLIELGRMLHLPLKQVGNNYLVHCALAELFQDQAPNPFSVEDSHRQMSEYKSNNGKHILILCYSELDWQSLQNLARGFASPTVYEIIDWDRIASKPMPDQFPEGMKLGFELRTCPVVRKASDGDKWKKGQEIDAFLSKVWHQFERQSGADLESVQMKRFSIERMTRRNHQAKRKVQIIQRPDVTFTGTISIKNGDEFKDLLLKGIGRHKSFGFGMLKIRRA